VKFLCLVFTLLCALSTFAATSKSVSYKSGDETVQALIYTPEGKGPFSFWSSTNGGDSTIGLRNRLRSRLIWAMSPWQ
jgi:hypothetical protein